MSLSVTLLFYLTIGAGVSLAVLTGRRVSGGHRNFLAATALLFWPLYVPLLLTAGAEPVPGEAEGAAVDGIAAAIAQVESELETALDGLDGWAEDVLDRERGRLAELKAALELQAARIRDMDALAALTRAAAQDLPLEEPLAGEPGAGSIPHEGRPTSGADVVERFRQSQQARAENLTRLAAVRHAAYADLMATLAWIRELVSMIHLARFTGAPAARAEELVAQIAAAVEGISAATWHETSHESRHVA